LLIQCVATPILRECEDEDSHSRVGTWEFTGTPETSESDCKGQNTLHRGILDIIEKLLKCRCLKWARMTHLDIYSTSYGKKKGRESNWQFDSQAQKVGNRPDPCACRWNVTHRLLQTSSQSKVWAQSCGSPNLGNFRTPPWESRDKKPFGCRRRREAHRILYGGRWWLPSSLGRGEFCESKVTCDLS
jgi:hypothetical protein